MDQKAARLTQYFAAATVSVGAVSVGTVLGFNSPASFQLRSSETNTSHSSDKNSTVEYSTSQVPGSHTRNLLWYVAAGLDKRPANEEGISWFSGSDNEMSVSLSSATASSDSLDNDIKMTTEELSWFMSIFALGALLGGLASSPLMNTVGRKGTLLASAVPSIVGWLMTGLGKAYPVLLIGRFLTGVFIGVNGAAGNAYIGEISSSDIRGILGSFYELFLVVGILLEMLVGAYTEWQVLALISIGPSVLFLVLMVFNKESPAFLLMKGKEEKARSTLQYFRGPHYSIEKEINEVKESQKEAKAASFKMADLKKPYIYKPMIATFTISMFAQLVGIEVITANLATIFQSTGTNLSENASSIICIFMEIVAGVVAIFLVERTGRKTLLIISAAILTVCLGGLGAYFYLLQEEEDWTTQHLSWLPLTSLTAYVLAYGIGIGPVVWILIGEMFPPMVRETAAGVAVAVIWTTSFFTVQSYEFLMDTLNSYGLYWLYTGFCGACTVFCIVVLKETKGKTLEEITQMFVKNKPLTDQETKDNSADAPEAIVHM